MMHAIIASLLLKNNPSEARLVLIDPKRTELTFYKNHPMLACPIAKSPEEALDVLGMSLNEMERRLAQMEAQNVRRWNGTKLYIFIDELADLMLTSKKQTEQLISRIAMLGRAAGIHLVCATQHPTANVVTSQIKNNMNTRIALHVANSKASYIVLDAEKADVEDFVGIPGAHKLTGKGDAILRNSDGSMQRFQGGYMSDDDLLAFCSSHVYEVIEEPKPQAPKFEIPQPQAQEIAIPSCVHGEDVDMFKQIQQKNEQDQNVKKIHINAKNGKVPFLVKVCEAIYS